MPAVCDEVLPEPVVTCFDEFESFFTVFDKFVFVLFFTGFDGAALDFDGFTDELELELDGFELLL